LIIIVIVMDVMIVIVVVMIIITITIIIIVMIHHSRLDLLGIEFHCFSMCGISDLITRITGLKSLLGLTSFFIFYLIVFFPDFTV
jgi:hypothetical protein